jgi:hypothetical protein
VEEDEKEDDEEGEVENGDGCLSRLTSSRVSTWRGVSLSLISPLFCWPRL